MADIYVTAELRDLGDRWEAVAYAEIAYRVTAPTEDEVKDAFVSMWNDTHDTEFELDNVDFVLQA